MVRPTVFISYSQKDEIWRERLRTHLETLSHVVDIMIWDDQKIDTGGKWRKELEEAMKNAIVSVCLVSADFLSSDFCMKEEVPYLLERQERQGMLLIPVILRPCFLKMHRWITETQMLPGKGKSIEKDFPMDWEAIFSKIVERIYKKIEEETDIKVVPIVSIQTEELIEFPQPSEPLELEWEPAEKVDISRMPQTGVELFVKQEEMKLFGRNMELDLLDKVWGEGKINIVSFVAWGGVGKSLLTKKWLEYMGKDNYRGAKRVYAWSFYSQGTGQRVTSADEFIAEALTWFGDKAMAENKKSPWDKGKRLAELIAKEKTLLILDGMEPLQSESKVEKGKIKDAALEAMLKGLAKDNAGLCVITTREKIGELGLYDETVKRVGLDQISKEAGRALLRVDGVQGEDSELEAAVEEFGRHALAVNLLATYLKGFADHHIGHAGEIPDLPGVKVGDGKHPRRVIEAIAGQLGDGPELEVLKILGLFDRPADITAINNICTNVNIDGLTDELHVYATFERKDIYDRLRELKLLAKESRCNPNVLDCHPLVREHFGEKLRDNSPDAWQAGHERLYEYYKDLPEKELPETLEEMEPLFRAVYHGCKACKQQETLYDIYWKRIQRMNDKYAERKLGVYGSLLGAVSCFFQSPFNIVFYDIRESDKALLFNQAGFFLRAVGRLREAAEPMGASLEFDIKNKRHRFAAVAAVNLSEVWLVMGDVGKAVDYGRESVEYADRSGNWEEKTMFRTTLADALHQAGDTEGAEKLFREAEGMQRERQPEVKYLYSVWGNQFCDLLLGQGRYGEVKERIRKTLEWAKQQPLVAPLDIGLDNLSLGRAYLLEYQQLKIKNKKDNDESKKVLAEGKKRLEDAVAGLREAGQQDDLARGLLARAGLWRVMGEYGPPVADFAALNKAEGDLAEAREIAERGEMELYLADCRLEGCRLGLAQGDRPRAREELGEAERLIEKMGYHRRDGEVAELKGRLV